MKQGLTATLILLLSVSLAAGTNLEFWHFEDPSKTLTSEDLFRLPDYIFQPPGPLDIDLNLTNWLRFRIPPSADSLRLCFPPGMDSILVFSRNGFVAVTGINVLPRHRDVADSKVMIRLPSDGGEFAVKLVNISRNFKARTVRDLKILTFIDATEWSTFKNAADLLQAPYRNTQRYFLLLLAVVLVLVLLSWVVLREVVYGRYACYVAALFLFYLVRRAYLFEAEWFPVTSSIRYAFELFWMPLILVTYVRFVVSFLRLNGSEQDVNLRRTLDFFVRFALLSAVATAMMLLFTGYYWTSMFNTAMRLLYAGGAFYVIWLLLQRNDRFARIISLGLSFLIIGLLLIIVNDWLKNQFGIDIEFGHLSFFQYAIVSELLLYWLGVHYRWYEDRQVSAKNQVELVRLRALYTSEHAARQQEWIVITTPRRQYRWARTQVQGFTADRELTICLLAGDQTARLPIRLGELEEQLPFGFLRVQRSYIVAVSQINRFDDGKQPRLFLVGRQKPVPVSKSLRQEIRQAITTSGG